MASDYGDEAGERLIDWMLRIGQDSSQEAMANGAKRLKEAIHNIRGKVTSDQIPAEDQKQRVKLNLSEFQDLPEYPTIKDVITKRLDFAAIDYEIADVDGKDYLIFPVDAAPEVDEVFANLERDIDVALEKAISELDLSQEKRIDNEHKRENKATLNRDEEPLAEKAEAAKAASHVVAESREAIRSFERTDGMSR